jgi:hypothetical protein
MIVVSDGDFRGGNDGGHKLTTDGHGLQISIRASQK